MLSPSGPVSATAAVKVADALTPGGRPQAIVASVFTPYQLLFLERLCAISPIPRILVLDARAERFRSGRSPQIAGAEVIALNLTGKVNDPEQAVLVRRGIAAVERFADGGDVTFLAASYQFPINNVAYRAHRHDPKWRFCLIEDGLSTFIGVHPSPRERLRNAVREVVARLRGFPARLSIPGHPLGLDLPAIRAIFVGVDRLPTSPRARPYVTLPPPAAAGLTYTPDAALMVGQPYAAELGLDVLRSVIAQSPTDLQRRGCTRIAFKPHHFQSPAEVAIYTDLGFEIVDPPITVEELIPASPFRTIAAINSTALLTTRSLFGDAVRAIAYAPSAVRPRHERRDPREIEAVFAAAGVEIVPVAGLDRPR
jgi:hypothetical protein